MPKAPLTRERILKKAIQIADKSNIESLSMRKLAKALGVEAMSLYNHVKNKDDLLDGIVEIVAAEIDIPRVGYEWKKEMRQRANSAHDMLLRHPWASMLLVSRINIGPVVLSYVNATIGCLVDAGFSYEMADRAWNAIDSHIYGFTLQELNFPFQPDEFADVAKQYLDIVPMQQYPYLNALAQQVIDGTHYGAQDFNFGLELVLNGLEKQLNNRSD